MTAEVDVGVWRTGGRADVSCLSCDAIVLVCVSVDEFWPEESKSNFHLKQL